MLARIRDTEGAQRWRWTIGPGWKKGLQIALGALGALGLLLAVGVWRLLHPGQQDLPLPPDLIALDSGPGQALLASALKADLPALQAHYVVQQTASFCGVASGVAALGALGQATDQDRFFDGPPGEVRGRYAVLFGGLELATLAALIQAHGLQAEAVYGSDLDLAGLRALLAANLADPADALIANFSRPTLGEVGGGHHSPIGAYDPASDRVLVLDTAAYKYPPTWVPADALLRAMQTEDSASGRSRGLVVVRAR